ncbi:MAG: DUF2807 domain-containing protein [Paludibacteraceae bacterium]|nr:DUF2807 domain-containing protein [Paludibacteraceae bacterium]
MNTTRSINLAGSAFYIDEEAYNTLKSYLQSIEKNLGNQADHNEVMHDIEARIAELFKDMCKKNYVDVVSLDMVRAVMQQLGKPDDFRDTTEESQPAGGNLKQFTRRKVYRDTEKQMIGGVCAGLGHWLGIDAIWVRIIFLLCLLLWGVTLPVYIILWIIMPEARTAAQRLDMRGEEPTVENIEKEVQQMREHPQNTGGGCLSTALKIMVWCIGGFFLLIAVSIFYSLLAGAVSMLPLGIVGIFFAHGDWQTWLLAIMIVLVIGVPVFAIAYVIIKSIRKDERISPHVLWISLVIWLIAAVGSVVLGIYEIVSNNEVQQALMSPEGLSYWDDDDEAGMQNTLKLDGFHSVEANGIASVTLTQADEQYVTVSRDTATGFKAEVRDSVLRISTDKRHVSVWVQVPEIKSIVAGSAAKVSTQGIVNCDNLTVDATGASKINMSVNASQVTVNADGASKISLNGNAERLHLTASGASKVDADDMSVSIANAEAHGASKVELNVSDTLNATASSMSKITYKGMPYVKTTANSGGKVRQDKD